LTGRVDSAWLLLAANVIYALVFQSTAATAVGVVGIVSALMLLAGHRLAPVWFGGEQRSLNAPDRLMTWGLPLLPFLSVLGQARLAFWRVDARGLILISWIITLAWMLVRRRRDSSQVWTLDGVAWLFMGWTALFWYSVVWDGGLSRLTLGLSHSDRLLESFAIWESNPVSSHLYLVWLRPEDFAAHRAYTNHLHPYLFAIYGWTRAVQLVAHVPAYVGRNLTPFLVSLAGVLAFGALVGRTRSWPADWSFTFVSTLFVALGLVITSASYWVGFYTINFDDVFPLIAYVTILFWVCARPPITHERLPIALAAAVAVGLFSWVYGPLIVAALVIYSRGHFKAEEADTPQNRYVWLVAAVALVIDLSIYELPRALVRLKGYESVASDFLFRSGLDGDVQYFQNAGQAVLQPFAQSRTNWAMLLPVVPLLFGLWWGPWRGRLGRWRLFSALVFLTAPYWFSVALFPQAVSIHPYLYDHLLLQPLLLLGASGMLTSAFQHRLRGAYLLLGLLAATTLTMANLIAIAQVARRLIPS